MTPLQVEGVIQRGSGVGHDRGDVSGVVVQLGCNLQPGSKTSDSKVDTTVNLEQLAEPHNDFFSSQFLVPFPLAGE